MCTIAPAWVITIFTILASTALTFLLSQPRQKPINRHGLITKNNNSYATDTPTTPFRLLDLPPELRTLIYHSLPDFPTPQQTISIGCGHHPQISPPTTFAVPPVAAVCRSIRTEVLQTLFSTAHFNFDTGNNSLPIVQAWLHAQANLSIAALRTVTFTNSYVAKPPPDSAAPDGGLSAATGNGDLSRDAMRWMALNYHEHVYLIDVRRGSVGCTCLGEDGCEVGCALAGTTVGKLEERLGALRVEADERRCLDRAALAEMCQVTAEGEWRQHGHEMMCQMIRNEKFRNMLKRL